MSDEELLKWAEECLKSNPNFSSAASLLVIARNAAYPVLEIKKNDPRFDPNMGKLKVNEFL